jgi:hypothetical protein
MGGGLNKVTSTVMDESGRVHITLTRDNPLNVVVTQNYSAINGATFVELARLDMDEVTRGQIIIGSSISPPAGFSGDSLIMEINIVGYLGATPTIVDRGALSQFSTARRFRFDDVENYTALGVEARQMVNGLPNSSATPLSLSFQAFGLFWS